MPGTATEYDSELLASAPEATKAQVQSGYAVDLLDQKDHPSRRASDKPEAARPTTATSVPALPLDGKTPPRPFYRTRRGIIIIIVAFFAIVAVIVGGAVGGTVGGAVGGSQKGSSLSSKPPTDNVPSTTSGTQTNGVDSPSTSFSLAGLTSTPPGGVATTLAGNQPTASQ